MTMTEASNTGKSPIVRAVNLSKQVASPEGMLQILWGIDFSIETGEAVAVVGASGSGKSTLLGLLAGLDLPTYGRVELDGTDLSTLDEDGRAALRGRMVGFIFQSFMLIPTLTAQENVMLPLELTGVGDAAERAGLWLERVGLTPRRQHRPHQLSGGEQQRVAIARAFATSPRLLFADEPTGNLDQRTGGHIIDLLFELNQDSGATLVLVTHDAGLAARCPRRLELEEGLLTTAPSN